MALGINTNVASLSAQNNLSSSQRLNDQALERLSSGLRINSAKDDAAGLAISSRFDSQIRGLGVAQRNANDGISLAQTAEGALGQAGDLLQRIRELSVQSANDTNSSFDRKSLQAEVTQLQSELNRVADTTNFNGQTLLNGDFANAQFQVGADANQTINVSLRSSRGTDIGNYVAAASGTGLGQATATNGVTGGTVTVSGNGKSGDYSVGANDSAATIAKGINASSDDTGVTASARTEATLSGFATGTVTLKLAGDNTAAGEEVSVSATIAADDFSALASAINDTTATTGITAQVVTDGGVDKLKLVNEKGNDINITAYDNSGTATAAVAGSAGGSVDLTSGSASANITGALELSSNSGFSVVSADPTSVASGGGELTSVAKIDITTTEGANKAINTIDAALATINGQRADLGAIQNRFTSTIDAIATTSENLSAAQSRILDADFASETAKLAKSQVLQQAGISVLAQANARPQQVLSLLQ